MEYRISYWEQKSFFESADIIIIGSGIVGLSTAISIKKNAPKHKILVLERGIHPIGASTRNAGFACIGSMTEILSDLSDHSESEVHALIRKRYNGLQLLKKTIGDNSLKYDPCGGFELFTHYDSESFQKCMSRLDYINALTKDITGHSDTFTPCHSRIKDMGLKGITHMILNRAEGSIDTGAMMKSLIDKARSLGIDILNGVQVESCHSSGNSVEIRFNKDFTIKASKVAITTNGFAKEFISDVDLQPARNQIIMTNNIPNLKLKGTFHFNQGYVYARNVDQRVLIGGYRNLDREKETTSAFGTSITIQNALLEFLSNHLLPYQKFEIEHVWSGIMGVGSSKQPIIKKIKDNMYTAVRMGGMGIAIGSLVGKELAELILE